jgi:hypothetical protein
VKKKIEIIREKDKRTYCCLSPKNFSKPFHFDTPPDAIFLRDVAIKIVSKTNTALWQCQLLEKPLFIRKITCMDLLSACSGYLDLSK